MGCPWMCSYSNDDQRLRLSLGVPKFRIYAQYSSRYNAMVFRCTLGRLCFVLAFAVAEQDADVSAVRESFAGAGVRSKVVHDRRLAGRAGGSYLVGVDDADVVLGARHRAGAGQRHSAQRAGPLRRRLARTVHGHRRRLLGGRRQRNPRRHHRRQWSSSSPNRTNASNLRGKRIRTHHFGGRRSRGRARLHQRDVHIQLPGRRLRHSRPIYADVLGKRRYRLRANVRHGLAKCECFYNAVDDLV